ncbi:hypothetical protein B1H38_11990 [Leptospira borgpetersenii serovar Ballum]|nr:hypothetical protein B1H38_11990 [Leptospira borgpetersenii serovar Ballum]
MAVPLPQKTVLGKLLVPSVGFLVLWLMLISGQRRAPFCLRKLKVSLKNRKLPQKLTTIKFI